MTEKTLLYRLLSVSVFEEIVKKEPLSCLTQLLETQAASEKRLQLYTQFVRSLQKYEGSLSLFLKKSLIESENVLIKAAARGSNIPFSFKENAKKELELFSCLSTLTPRFLLGEGEIKEYAPLFENEETDFSAFYEKRIRAVKECGYGIFASHGMFRVENNEIVPVEVADDISVDCFVGYEAQRQTVLDNTLALTQGRPCQNILLCGDAGTGKSSTVKACANSFFSKGVRLIELRKDQLFSLSFVMGAIAENPLKFIIFIDDLSFNKNDDCFSMLKAVLEGSAAAKSKNAVIYATSNRRHIVKESFADRTGTDDVHRNDTMQELLSLSDRFGLTVYFGKPDKALYLRIVESLAEKNNVPCTEQLRIKAEAFALSKGNRSPRTAEQFIKSIL